MKQIDFLLIKLKLIDKCKRYKCIMAVLFGFLGAVSNLCYILLEPGNIFTACNWSILFLLLITLEWGRCYGLISIVFGFMVFNPYYLGINYAWMSLVPVTNLILWIIIIGKYTRNDRNIKNYYIHLILSHMKYIVICVSLTLSFLYLSQHSLLFGSMEAFVNLQYGSIAVMIFKNLVLQTILLAVCDILLLFPFVRKIFRIEISRFSRYNTPIILGVIISGILVYFFIMMDYYISDAEQITLQWMIHPSEKIVMNLLITCLFCLIFGGVVAKIFEKQMEINERLQLSEAKYHSIFDNFNDIYLETTLEGVILTVSPSIEKLLGYQDKTLIGSNIDKIYINSSERDSMLEVLLQDKEIINYEVKIKDINEKRHNIWIHAKTVTDFFGKQKIIAIFRDVTRFTEEHRKREESEKNYKLLFDKMMNGFIVMEPVYNNKKEIEDVAFVDLNPGFEKITGLSQKDVIGRTWFDVFQYRNRCLEEYEEILQTEEYLQHEIYNPVLMQYHKCGTFKINDNRIGGIFEDITKSKKAEEEIKELAANLKAIFESTQDNIWLVDENFNLITCNQAFYNTVQHFMGFEFENRNDIKDILPKDLLAKWEKLYLKAMKGQFTIEDEFSDTIFEVSFNPIFRDGKVAGVAVFGKNITDRKTAEKALAQLNIEIEQRVQDRTLELQEALSKLEAFTYMVTHDLKSPLRAIDAYSGIMIEDYQDQMIGEMGELTVKIKQISRDMISMINKLHQYSTTTEEKINKEIININEIITLTFDELTSAFPERKIKLILQSELPLVMADKILIRRVMDNIISNAVKFTRTRTTAFITVNHSIQNEEVIISVNDNGVGFDRELSGKLFNIFERLHLADEYEGSGIGLAMVRKIIQLHGGRTWIEGNKDLGATVYFTLPVAL